MAEITLVQKTPLDGADVTIGDIRIREVTDTGLYSLAIPQRGDQAVAAALKTFGLDMPDSRTATATSTASASMRAVKTTTDQLFLFFEATSETSQSEIIAAFGKVGYLTVQTDNWVMCEICGQSATAALERICPIDLHDTAFPMGSFARTSMEHLGAAILRTGPDSYLLMSASSSAQSFFDALTTSAQNVEGAQS